MLARAQAVDRARVYRDSILPLKLAIDLRYAERHRVCGDLFLLLRTVALPGVRAWRGARCLIGPQRTAAAPRGQVGRGGGGGHRRVAARPPRSAAPF